MLTRAHIRIVSNSSNNMSIRRLLPDFASLYNNSPQGIFQDIIEDMLEAPASESGRRNLSEPLPGGLILGNGGGSLGINNGSFGLGGLGFLNNYIEQMI